MGYGSFKVIENGTIRYAFLLAFHSKYGRFGAIHERATQPARHRTTA